MKRFLLALTAVFFLLTLTTIVTASDGTEHGCTICGVDYACNGGTSPPSSDGECMATLCGADCTDQASGPNNCDPDCSYSESLENDSTECTDGLDNDCDGDIDWDDTSCTSTCGDGICGPSENTTTCQTDCCSDSGYVNNCDATDDKGCWIRDTSPYNACDLTSAQSCKAEGDCPDGNCFSDGVDNDCDGYSDEADSGANINLTFSENPSTPGTEVDAITTAEDGSWNASQPEVRKNSCSGELQCTGTTCPVTVPDTSTTYYTCVDSNQDSETLSPYGSEVDCNDQLDNDNNGLTDEEDPACQISVDVQPSTATYEDTLTATVTADDGSLTQTVEVREGSCSGTKICDISTSGGTCDFNVPACNSTYLGGNGVDYYACLGNNQPSTTVTYNTPSEDPDDNTDNDCDGYADEADSDTSSNTSASSDPTTMTAGDSVNLTFSTNAGTFPDSEELNFCDSGGCTATGECNGTGVSGCTGINVSGETSYQCQTTVSDTQYYACYGQTSKQMNLDVKENCANEMEDNKNDMTDEADPDCTITLSFDKNNVDQGTIVEATLSSADSKLTTDKDLYFRNQSCTSGGGLLKQTDISTLDSKEHSFTFEAPHEAGTHTFYACLGTSTNSDSEDLDVTGEPCRGADNCTQGATLQGTVTDDKGNPLADATVRTFYPPSYGASDDSTTTDVNGDYTLDVVNGTYPVKASKDEYFTQEKEVTTSVGETKTIDYTLDEGTCNADCYNWEGRCNAECDGRTFEDGQCSFPTEKAKEKVDGKQVDTWVKYNQSGDNITYVIACEGPFRELHQPYATVNGTIEELYKRERIVKSSRTDQVVKLIINLWPGN